MNMNVKKRKKNMNNKRQQSINHLHNSTFFFIKVPDILNHYSFTEKKRQGKEIEIKIKTAKREEKEE